MIEKRSRTFGSSEATLEQIVFRIVRADIKSNVALCFYINLIFEKKNVKMSQAIRKIRLNTRNLFKIDPDVEDVEHCTNTLLKNKKTFLDLGNKKTDIFSTNSTLTVWFIQSMSSILIIISSASIRLVVNCFLYLAQFYTLGYVLNLPCLRVMGGVLLYSAYMWEVKEKRYTSQNTTFLESEVLEK